MEWQLRHLSDPIQSDLGQELQRDGHPGMERFFPGLARVRGAGQLLGGEGWGGLGPLATVAAATQYAEDDELGGPATTDYAGADVGAERALPSPDVERVPPGVQPRREQENEQ